MKNILCALIAVFFAVAALGEESKGRSSQATDPVVSFSHRGLTFVNAVVRQPPPAAEITAGFLEIINDSDEDDVLLSASAAFAARVEIHQTLNDNGVMRMRPLPQGMAVGGGDSIVLQPGGAHLMFFGVDAVAPDGEEVVLNFAQRGALTVRFSVGAPATPAAEAHSHSHSH